jgi:hypothetical protein
MATEKWQKNEGLRNCEGIGNMVKSKEVWSYEKYSAQGRTGLGLQAV